MPFEAGLFLPKERETLHDNACVAAGYRGGAESAFKMKGNAVLAVTLMLASTPAFCAPNGAALFEWCMSPEMTAEHAGCTLYISGFVQALHFEGDKDKAGLVCLPSGLTGEEARAAFVRVMRSFGKGPNPITEGPIDAALLAALGMAYRCPRNSN
jgi:hypothetical protein